jgi:branched-chain amino acid aminotransferase
MSMADKDGVIWGNGELIPWREAKVHFLTHTLHYGMGVFEGVRAYETVNGPAIFRLAEHTKRLFNSAKILGMAIPYSEEDLCDAQLQVVRENRHQAAYIRPMCFYGSEAMGLHCKSMPVQTMVACWKWGAYLGEGLEKGVRVHTSTYTRNHINSVFCKAKASGNYINSLLAAQEAEKLGYDEALLLDHEGFVAEGSGENIFMVRDGKLYTPDTASILEGITRDTIMQLARDLGYSVSEKRITRDELYIADEAFFTGTAAEVTPICEVDDRRIGNGQPGVITKVLQTRYFDIVHGRDEHYKKWLSYVC